MRKLLLLFAVWSIAAITSQAATISGTITYAGSYGAAINQKVYLIDSTTSGANTIDSTFTSSTGAYSFSLTMITGHSYNTLCNSCSFPSYCWAITSSTSSANMTLYCAPFVRDTLRVLSSLAAVSGQKVYIKNSTATYKDSSYTDYYGAVTFYPPASLSAGTLTFSTTACGLQTQSVTYTGAPVIAPTLYLCNFPTVSGTLTNVSTSSPIPYYKVGIIDSSTYGWYYIDSVYTNSSGVFTFTLPFNIPSGNMVVFAQACGTRYRNSAAYSGSNLTLNLNACATSTATISGILYVGGTFSPVVGQKVYFQDSTASIVIRDSVLSSSTGAYSFAIPVSTLTASLKISTVSCGALQSKYQVYTGYSIGMPYWSIYSGVSRTISGTIHYKNGPVAPGINVIFYDLAGSYYSVNVTTGPSGTYSLSVPCDWNVGNILVQATITGPSCPGYLNDTVLWSGSTTTTGWSDTLSVNAPPTISGTVYYANGTPVTLGQVYLANVGLPGVGTYTTLSSTGTYSYTVPCNWTPGTIAITSEDYPHCTSPYHYFTWSGSSMSNVNDTICLFRISGNVYKQGGGPAANAKVYAVRSLIDTTSLPYVTSLTALDSTITNASGFYQFDEAQDPYVNFGVHLGYYATYVKAALQPSDPFYSNFLPTYHDSALVWNSADTVASNIWYNRLGGVNIFLRAGTNPGGPAFIGGNVLLGANKSAGVGDPLSERILLLTTSTGKAVGYTYSDAAGKFVFPSLAYGSYLVFGDAWGKTNPVLAVTLSAANPIVNNIVFEENSKHFEGHFSTAVPTVSALDMVRVYPNPVTAKINFVGLNTIKSEKQAVIRNATGAVVLQTMLTGSSIDASKLASGVYMVQLITDKGTANFRFVKE